MRILVTGATGFVGRAFCRAAIRQGHQVLALTRNSKPCIISGIEIASGSLIDTPWRQVARFKPEAVLHLAWTVDPGACLNSLENEVLLEQSKIWFQRLFEIGVPYVAGTGSCIEYAPSTEVLVEDISPLGPRLLYSKSKVALHEWLREHAPRGCGWFRIFYAYGNNENPRRLVSSTIFNMLSKKEVVLKTPMSVKDYIHVDDVADALCFLLENSTTGAVNIGTGKGVRVIDLVEMIASLIGADSHSIKIQDDSYEDAMPHVVANATKLMTTGWRQKIYFSEGLQEMIKDIKEKNF